jgi:hypothetical protein
MNLAVSIVCRDLNDVVMFHQKGMLQPLRAKGYVFTTTHSVIESYGFLSIQLNSLINTNLLQIKKLNEFEYSQSVKIYKQYQSALSLTDCTVIYYASSCSGTLITNENIIIKVCNKLNINCQRNDMFSNDSMKILKRKGAYYM